MNSDGVCSRLPVRPQCLLSKVLPCGLLLVVDPAWFSFASDRSVHSYSIRWCFVLVHHISRYIYRWRHIKQLVCHVMELIVESNTNLSPNRSIENQLLSTWNSYTALIVNWTLNFSTDLLRT
jgi:hypothetical protein